MIRPPCSCVFPCLHRGLEGCLVIVVGHATAHWTLHSSAHLLIQLIHCHHGAIAVVAHALIGILLLSHLLLLRLLLKKLLLLVILILLLLLLLLWLLLLLLRLLLVITLLWLMLLLVHLILVHAHVIVSLLLHEISIEIKLRHSTIIVVKVHGRHSHQSRIEHLHLPRSPIGHSHHGGVKGHGIPIGSSDHHHGHIHVHHHGWNASHHHLLLLLLLRSARLHFVIQQELSHFGGTLTQCLRGLFPGRVVSNFKPEARLFHLFEETASLFTYGIHNGTRNGRLVVLSGLQVIAAVQIDQVAELAVARVKIRSSAAA